MTSMLLAIAVCLWFSGAAVLALALCAAAGKAPIEVRERSNVSHGGPITDHRPALKQHAA